MAPQVPKPFFLLMEDGNKVVLFYISNALIQDIPFWPLFVLATAAQQQEEKNGTTSVILFIFLQSGLLGRLGQPVEHGHMDIMRETLYFHHHVSWHCYPDLSKKYLAHLWCHPYEVVCDVKAFFLAFDLTTCWAKTFDACKDQDACRITKTRL